MNFMSNDILTTFTTMKSSFQSESVSFTNLISNHRFFFKPIKSTKSHWARNGFEFFEE